MKILYYVLFGFFGLLGGWFVLSSLLGRFSLWNANQLYSKIVLCVAAVMAIVLLLPGLSVRGDRRPVGNGHPLGGRCGGYFSNHFVGGGFRIEG
jgi:heme A synthase